MNSADQNMIRNERDASPERFPVPPPAAHNRQSHEIERIPTASSASTTSSDATRSQREREDSISRIPTQRDLERHPTVLSRIHTARSQHAGTIGRAPTTKSRDSRRPLPDMGLGKSLPPALPDREEYVVEFSGPDDPLHAMNWPMKKKYVTNSS